MSHIVVIGAGVGGLSAAIDLQRQGCSVTLVEANDAPGGKMREIEVDGARVDSGPTVLTMRWVFEDLFRDARANLADRVTLTPLSVLARHAWSESERLDLFADPDATSDAIGAFAGAKEARGYQGFRKRVRQIYETLEDSFIRSPRSGALGLVRRSGGLASLLKISPFKTMWNEIGRYFEDPRLRQLFGRYATYTGSSPFEAPATLMLIAHVEMDGVWSVAGGMQRLAEAMEQLATELGVKIRYRSRTTEIAIERDRVSRVQLESGESINCDAVVMNGNPAGVAQGLLGPNIKGAASPISESDRSLSAITWSFKAHANGFPLNRHSVFFSRDYAREFDELRSHLKVPHEPTVYLHCQDRTGGASDVQEERIFCIINAPAIGDRHSFPRDEIEAHQRNTLERMSQCGLTLDITDCQATSPRDFERRFPGSGGALYGSATHGSQAAFRRPASRTKIKGLYFAGGSTHPGAGVPNSTLSGRLAAAAVIEDFSKRR